MRGEPTGPLPVPNVAPKRRYEATPSAVTQRPLAPHTDIDQSQKPRSVVPSSISPPPLGMRPAEGAERNASRYHPLAQAPTGAPTISEETSRAARQPGAAPPRVHQGPRLGYFSDDRRGDLRTTALAPARTSQEPHSSPHPAAMHGSPVHSEMPRLEQLSSQHLLPRTEAQYQGSQQQVYAKPPQQPQPQPPWTWTPC